MARMRTLKPETFTSETLSLAPVHARWTFAGLWTYADDEGRGKADPRLIKAAIWPLDDDVLAADVAEHLDVLEKLYLLCRYEHAGKRYVHIVNFKEHQRPNRPVESKLPACPKKTHGGFAEPSLDPHEGLTAPAVSRQGVVTTIPFTNTPIKDVVVVVDGVVDGVSSSEIAARSSDTDDQDDEAPGDREDVERLCTHLADRVEGNGSKRPRITRRWRDSARLLIDKDQRTEQQVRTCIDWCQDDEFWRPNVMSMPKLREKYDQLRLAAEAKRRTTNGRESPPGQPPLESTSTQRARAAVEAGREVQAMIDRGEIPA